MGRKIKKEVRTRVWKKYKYRCAYCGKILSYLNMHIDHIIPHCDFDKIKRTINRKKEIITFGADNYKNLNPSCYLCNHWKKDLTIQEFRKEIQNKKQIEKKSISELKLILKYGLVKILNKEIKFFFETCKENK